MNDKELKKAVEAILFASGEPVSLERLALVLDSDGEHIRQLATEMARDYEERDSGIRLVRLESSLQLHSVPECAEFITHALEQRRPPRLTQTSLEVLSIVAYFQPVTRAYVEQVRGVDSSYTVSLLAERGLIEACGHLDTVGRPTLYRTSDLFLRTMGLSSIEELPPLPELTGSEAAREIQKKVDALRAAEELQQASEETPSGAGASQ